MEIEYVQQCDYVSIFDADFQPAPDFLMRTVPFLMHNPEIALVQARWKFGEPISSLFVQTHFLLLLSCPFSDSAIVYGLPVISQTK